MYCNAVYVDKCEHKTDVGQNKSELWEVMLKDLRPKKDGGEYTAFMFKATFWGSTQPCQEGEYIVICGDMVNNYWKDQKSGDMKSFPELRNPKILNMIDGRDETPKKERVEELEQDGVQEEIPF